MEAGWLTRTDWIREGGEGEVRLCIAYACTYGEEEKGRT